VPGAGVCAGAVVDIRIEAKGMDLIYDIIGA